MTMPAWIAIALGRRRRRQSWSRLRNFLRLRNPAVGGSHLRLTYQTGAGTSNAMHTYWTAFPKADSPASGGGPSWP
jgi:hypothetical protein